MARTSQGLTDIPAADGISDRERRTMSCAKDLHCLHRANAADDKGDYGVYCCGADCKFEATLNEGDASTPTTGGPCNPGHATPADPESKDGQAIAKILSGVGRSAPRDPATV